MNAHTARKIVLGTGLLGLFGSILVTCVRGLEAGSAIAGIVGLGLLVLAQTLQHHDSPVSALPLAPALAPELMPMADAFPKEVRFFMDMAQRASDLNALLQGLLGRACGYGKRSTVVMSDFNADIVRLYVNTNGGYVHRTSRHTIVVGGYRRGAPTSMLRLRAESDDPVVQKFFERINKEVVALLVKPGAEMAVPRMKGGEVRRAPILRIAEDLGLFDHLEKDDVRATEFPSIPTPFHVVRRGEHMTHPREKVKLTYSTDKVGNCRFTFRHSDRASAAKGGAAGRAMGKKDVGQHIEPTIYLEKYDPVTGEVIDKDDDTVGHWRAFMVIFPLRDAVREVRVAEVALPKDTSPYSHYMNEEERRLRDQGGAGGRVH